jgi:hypothetical protein
MRQRGTAIYPTIRQAEPMTTSQTSSRRCWETLHQLALLDDRQISGNAAHRSGGLDPSLTLRVGMAKAMAEANQSTPHHRPTRQRGMAIDPITTRRVSEGRLSTPSPPDASARDGYRHHHNPTRQRGTAIYPTIRQAEPMTTSQTSSRRCWETLHQLALLADRQISGNAAHRAGGLDPSLTLRVGMAMAMAQANQSTPHHRPTRQRGMAIDSITARRVSEGWLSTPSQPDASARDGDHSTIRQVEPMTTSQTSSRRCLGTLLPAGDSLIGRSWATLHTGAADWIPR